MEVESAKCECCELREDCTRGYILGVKADFGGRWLCGLCSEAVVEQDDVYCISELGFQACNVRCNNLAKCVFGLRIGRVSCRFEGFDRKCDHRILIHLCDGDLPFLSEK
uniref:Uncharacterized protein n=1 Tax=Oryza brachyantha TaxID=4533 RepID=J3LK81_ORYBR